VFASVGGASAIVFAAADVVCFDAAGGSYLVCSLLPFQWAYRYCFCVILIIAFSRSCCVFLLSLFLFFCSPGQWHSFRC